MDYPRVLVVVITANQIEPKCYFSIINQDYPNYGIFIRVDKYKKQNDNWCIDKYLNCSQNRELARQQILKDHPEINYFLFMDSDIELPLNGLSHLMKHNLNKHTFDVIGGWYKIMDDTRYACGKWVADNTFINFKTPEKSVIKVDMVGFGCLLISRRALEKVAIRDGTSIIIKDEFDRHIFLGECGDFGNQITDLGYNLYMDGDVVCNHIKREKEEIDFIK